MENQDHPEVGGDLAPGEEPYTNSAEDVHLKISLFGNVAYFVGPTDQSPVFVHGFEQALAQLNAYAEVRPELFQKEIAIDDALPPKQQKAVKVLQQEVLEKMVQE